MVKKDDDKDAKKANDGKPEKILQFNNKQYRKSDIEGYLSRLRVPKEPEAWECCGGSCGTCVYDVYDHNCEQYAAAKDQLNSLLLYFEED